MGNVFDRCPKRSAASRAGGTTYDRSSLLAVRSQIGHTGDLLNATGMLKAKPISFKTVLCRSYRERGKCPRGQKCTFAHGDAELLPGHDGVTSDWWCQEQLWSSTWWSESRDSQWGDQEWSDRSWRDSAWWSQGCGQHWDEQQSRDQHWDNHPEGEWTNPAWTVTRRRERVWHDIVERSPEIEDVGVAGAGGTPVCCFFLRGKCKYRSCKYLHEDCAGVQCNYGEMCSYHWDRCNLDARKQEAREQPVRDMRGQLREEGRGSSQPRSKSGRWVPVPSGVAAPEHDAPQSDQGEDAESFLGDKDFERAHDRALREAGFLDSEFGGA